MKRTFASFEHSPLGFAHVVLKWTESDGVTGEAYYTVRGIIQAPWTWRNPHPGPFIAHECELFDQVMRSRFANDPTVQG